MVVVGRGQCPVLAQVTGVSVCAVPSRVHPLRGGEEGPHSVRQQRAARDGRVSERPFRGGVAGSAGSPGALGLPERSLLSVPACQCRGLAVKPVSGTGATAGTSLG